MTNNLYKIKGKGNCSRTIYLASELGGSSSKDNALSKMDQN